MQVVESSPLAAIKAIFGELGVVLPAKFTGSRDTTNAHELFGLHCHSEPALRMCIELLPNSLELLTAPGLLKLFPPSQQRPQGVYQKPREPSDDKSVYWPSWLHQQMDNGTFTGRCSA